MRYIRFFALGLTDFFIAILQAVIGTRNRMVFIGRYIAEKYNFIKEEWVYCNTTRQSVPNTNTLTLKFKNSPPLAGRLFQLDLSFRIEITEGEQQGLSGDF